MKIACRGLGLRSLMIDLGVEMNVRMSFDSTGAKGIASKKGVETRTLWLQYALGRKRFSLRKVLGKVNPADIGTKILPVAEVWANLALMGMKPVAGQAKSQKAMIEDEAA